MMLVLRPYFLFLGLVFAVEGMAQLPDGSIAPDFTATDLDGVEHNVARILKQATIAPSPIPMMEVVVKNVTPMRIPAALPTTTATA